MQSQPSLNQSIKRALRWSSIRKHLADLPKRFLSVASFPVTGKPYRARAKIWLPKILLLIVLIGLFPTEEIGIPVKGATKADWNHKTFWYEPWGSSGVHKGIDIFGLRDQPVVAATPGLVVSVSDLSKGGKVVYVLGPKWRLHYYAHLNSQMVFVGQWLSLGEVIGSLGDSGNAVGKPPHLHYSIMSLLTMPWRITSETQGWKKMFYLSPHKKLIDLEK